MSTYSISENLDQIWHEIEESCRKCGRNSNEITLIAVSKTKPHDSIIDAYSAGQLHFGENRMQELQNKMETIELPNVQWHMIGTIQSNKIKYIADRVDWIHSVSRVKHLDEINKRAKLANRIIKVLVQVNISGEDQKSGCMISELSSILKHAKTLPHIKVKGLMGLATFVDNPDDARSEFALLKTTLESHLSFNGENIQLTELSMGMSGDFKVAIEEGSTMIRIGSAIFGSRN